MLRFVRHVDSPPRDEMDHALHPVLLRGAERRSAYFVMCNGGCYNRSATSNALRRRRVRINATACDGERSRRVVGSCPGDVGDGIRTRDLRIPQERRGRITTETL